MNSELFSTKLIAVCLGIFPKLINVNTCSPYNRSVCSPIFMFAIAGDLKKKSQALSN